jgi:ABC-type transporter MlaC component
MSTSLDSERIKEFQEDVKYLHSNYNSLLGAYDGQFVAIKNKTVLDSDNDLDRLKEKLNQKGIEPATT